MDGLSVIISIYNPKYLDRCFDGFRRQSYNNYELIIINDGGDEIEMPTDLPIVYHYFGPKTTEFRLAAARNIGAKLAKYNRLVFTDHDCVPSSDFLLGHLNHSYDHLVSGIRRNMLSSPYESEVKVARWVDDTRLKLIDKLVDKFDIARNCFGCNLAVDKDVFMRVNGFDESFIGWGYEDTEFSIRVASLGYSLAIDESIITYHIHHGPNANKHLEINRQKMLDTLSKARFGVLL